MIHRNPKKRENSSSFKEPYDVRSPLIYICHKTEGMAFFFFGQPRNNRTRRLPTMTTFTCRHSDHELSNNTKTISILLRLFVKEKD